MNKIKVSEERSGSMTDKRGDLSVLESDTDLTLQVDSNGGK